MIKMLRSVDQAPLEILLLKYRLVTEFKFTDSQNMWLAIII